MCKVFFGPAKSQQVPRNRIASSDKQAISETKRFADAASLPPDFEIASEREVFFAPLTRSHAEEDQDVNGAGISPAA